MREWERARERELMQTRASGLLVPDTFDWYANLTARAFTANRITLNYLGPVSHPTEVTHAVFNVTTASAAAKFQAALYFFDSAETAFRAIPGTLFEYVSDGSATGVQTVALKRPALVKQTTALFFGQWCNDATLALAGPTAANFVLGHRAVSNSNGLTSQLPTIYIPVTSADYMVSVCYLSRLGKTLLVA